MATSYRSKWTFGQVVYHKVAAEQEPMVVVGVTFTAGGYAYVCGKPDGETATHYECELTEDFIGVVPPSQDDSEEEDD